MGEFDAVLVNVRVAGEAPEALGVKVTVKGTDWPSATVAGSAMPDSAYSALLLLAAETVTVPPLALRLAVREELVPTATLPKFSFVGATDNWPCVIPTPESEIFNGELDASETIESVPFAAPAADGANITVTVTL